MTDRYLDASDAAIRPSYPRVYAAPDGASHFEDIAVPMAPVVDVAGIPLVDVAMTQPVTELRFSRLEAGWTSDWHPAPRRQFVLVLTVRHRSDRDRWRNAVLRTWERVPR